MKIKKKWVVITVVALGCVGYYVKPAAPLKLNAKDFELVSVQVGQVVQDVTATGSIEPINTVDVGTQVSGIIETILADYNDEVTEGQLLAQIDTSVLIETKNDAFARLELAKAQQKVASLNYNRYTQLYKDKLIAKSTLEDAEVALAVCDADVLTATAAYNIAQRNFDYARIISPISGTIISREVEQGQTVAASLETPTLFTIAQDLTAMQIEANIAEADIGSIKNGMEVSFTVDAYPTDVFKGKVHQIRLSPIEESNVVMYTVIIHVDNKSRKLLPGMTAFVNIIINDLENVMRIPTTVLQYKPNAYIRKFLPDTKLDLNAMQSVAYVYRDNKIVPVVFTRGISDAYFVQVLDGLQVGDKVISEYIQSSKKR